MKGRKEGRIGDGYWLRWSIRNSVAFIPNEIISSAQFIDTLLHSIAAAAAAAAAAAELYTMKVRTNKEMMASGGD